MSDADDAPASAHRQLYDELQRRREEAAEGGGKARIERQHEKDKLTARERLDILLDDGSFEELGTFVRHQESNFGLDENRLYGDGVLTGYGTTHGRLVHVFSQDFAVYGGSLGRSHADKIVDITEKALENDALFIGLNDSGGARIQEGVKLLYAFCEAAKDDFVEHETPSPPPTWPPSTATSTTSSNPAGPAGDSSGASTCWKTRSSTPPKKHGNIPL